MRFFFFVAFILGVGLWGWWSFARRPRTSGALSALELKGLLGRRSRSPRIEAALVIRFNVVEEAKKVNGADPTPIVDPAIRALARQEELLEKIAEAQATTTKQELHNQLGDAKVEVELAKTPADRDVASKKAIELEARLAQLDALDSRKAELESAADQLVFGLRGVHLAMLDAASQQASTADPLAAAYAKLTAAQKNAT